MGWGCTCLCVGLAWAAAADRVPRAATDGTDAGRKRDSDDERLLVENEKPAEFEEYLAFVWHGG